MPFFFPYFLSRLKLFLSFFLSLLFILSLSQSLFLKLSLTPNLSLPLRPSYQPSRPVPFRVQTTEQNFRSHRILSPSKSHLLAKILSRRREWELGKEKERRGKNMVRNFQAQKVRVTGKNRGESEIEETRRDKKYFSLSNRVRSKQVQVSSLSVSSRPFLSDLFSLSPSLSLSDLVFLCRKDTFTSEKVVTSTLKKRFKYLSIEKDVCSSFLPSQKGE